MAANEIPDLSDSEFLTQLCYKYGPLQVIAAILRHPRGPRLPDKKDGSLFQWHVSDVEGK